MAVAMTGKRDVPEVGVARVCVCVVAYCAYFNHHHYRLPGQNLLAFFFTPDHRKLKTHFVTCEKVFLSSLSLVLPATVNTCRCCRPRTSLGMRTRLI